MPEGLRKNLIIAGDGLSLEYVLFGVFQRRLCRCHLKFEPAPILSGRSQFPDFSRGQPLILTVPDLCRGDLDKFVRP
jgi:hypothetical protein